MAEERRRAAIKGYKLIIAGDFNAEVGHRMDFDDDTIIRQRHLSEYLTAQALRQRHPRMVPYGLRRACLTIMAAAGVDEDDRLDFAGHTRDNGKLSSHSRYIDPDPSRFRHVAQLLTETELQCIARR